MWKGILSNMACTVRERIEKYINENLKEKRLKHTYSVAKEAVKLSQRYGEDEEKAYLAALFHDMFRSAPVNALNMYIKHLDLPKKLIDNPNLAHGKIAAEIMRRDYGVADEDIINAVSYHTTGRANMSRLEKIIFLADAIEPGRNYPSVEKTRKLAYEDLDEACINSLKRTVEYVNSKGEYLDQDTVDALDFLLNLKERTDL